MSHTFARKANPPAPATPSQGTTRRYGYPSRGASLGLSANHTDDLIRAVKRGFPIRALQSFSAVTGLSPSRIASVIEIPERTFARRRGAGRLASDESERLLRIATVFEKAVELFEGDVSEALHWLATPKKTLGNNIPLSYSRFEPGAREVENLIGRLEHGVFT
jgi:putative toxin-antitoxin system antitoxin component (TIGR02293 family)